MAPNRFENPDDYIALLAKIVKKMVDRFVSPVDLDELSDNIIQANIFPFDSNSPISKSNLRVYVGNAIFELLTDSSRSYVLIGSNSVLGLITKDIGTLEKKINKPLSHSMISDILNDADHDLRILTIRLSQEDNNLDDEIKDSVLAKGLEDSDVRVRCASLILVPDRPGEAVEAAVIDLLSDSLLQEEVLSCIKFDRILAAYPIIGEMSLSADEDICRMGVHYLAHIDSYEAVPHMIKYLDQMGGSEIYEENYEIIKNNCLDTARGVERMPTHVKDALVEYCVSEDLVIQTLALRCLASRWVTADIPTIEAINCDKNPLAVELKLRALYKKKAPKSIDLAKKYLNSEHSGIRTAAMEVLGDIGGKAELKLLREIAVDTERHDTPTAMEAFHKIKERLEKKK
ncbi:MAG: HEAT repeat domain-containing protein [Candidatus Marinimicrobia bacterium]|nr:HEAT repeat domain-containing protein [Candidatus Neomarinimicrobiota bacterium]